MQLEFPYQIVTFLDREPQVNEPVYYGPDGWFPQLALKRRFKLKGTSEEVFVESLKALFNTSPQLDIITGSLLKPVGMPVQVLAITNQDELKAFHEQIITHLGDTITSRYPERDGDNYYPHITAEYNNAIVIDTNAYANNRFPITNVWLLKDIGNENSIAYIKIR